MLIIPQIPLTIGNACVGTADTCTSLFKGNAQLRKAKAGKFAFSMGLMNLPAGLLGAVPIVFGIDFAIISIRSRAVATA
jgi:SulP family sulfate permease